MAKIKEYQLKDIPISKIKMKPQYILINEVQRGVNQ